MGFLEFLRPTTQSNTCVTTIAKLSRMKGAIVHPLASYTASIPPESHPCAHAHTCTKRRADYCEFNYHLENSNLKTSALESKGKGNRDSPDR
jgi:hypothetical protein